jgi:L-ribulose-5-phosphate 4-epimerase
MNYERLRKETFEANLELPALGLVDFTWGNVSIIDPETKLVAIKPSGVPYDRLKPEDIVLVDLQGKRVEGSLNPSSDLDTHLELYRNFPGIVSIVHTHSAWATAWAQACRAIPALGTTHADYFRGAVPCTRQLSPAETGGAYELETGRVIVETFAKLGIDPLRIPAVLVANHGPFAWGSSGADAVHNAAVLDITAKLAFHTLQLEPAQPSMPDHLLSRHFDRKHGPGAYYGQGKRK